MRFTFQLIFVFIFSSSVLFAQYENRFSVAFSQLKTNKQLVDKASIPKSDLGHDILILEVPFSNANFIAPIRASHAKGKVIEKVQLIYTTFAVSPDFDQQKLNQQRLRNLFVLLPEAFSNPMTEWELIGQTDAKSVEEGKKYFHGFIITWRPDASTSLVKDEMRSLDSLFLPLIRGGGFTPSADSLKEDIRIFTTPNGSKTVLDRNISEDSLWRFIQPSGKGFFVKCAKWDNKEHTMITVLESSENGYNRYRTWKLDDHLSDVSLVGRNDTYLNNPDSVVTTVMKRNAWDHIVIVADVTGSMSPYTAQVLAWVPVGLAGGKCAGFIFFNDGDGKSTNRKDIGKTGGIYSIQTQQFDSVFFTMKKAMNAGDGGDLAENPVEAMIFSIHHFPITTEIILIADNFSSPRDLELFEKVDRPVHIVLCGARGTVNPDYLFLARQTHGTIHTVHDDILHLDQMKDGEVVVIEGKHYLLHDEHFICNEAF